MYNKYVYMNKYMKAENTLRINWKNGNLFLLGIKKTYFTVTAGDTEIDQ